MKLKISSLIVVTTTIIVFIASNRNNGVNGDVTQLIENYYRCLNLSSLNDSFWRGLANMNLDEGMQFVRSIYTSSQINQSTCFAHFDDHKYGFLFRSKNQSSLLFDGVKSIIAAFDNKYNNENHLKPLADSLELIRIKQKSPEVVDVMRKLDFTERRFRFYENLPNCERKIDTETYINCYLPAQVENRSVLADPLTNAQLERKMICELMRIADCTQDEMRRFKALQLWVRQFSALRFDDNSSWSSLPLYLDSLVKRAKNYESTIKFRTASMTSILNGLLVKPYKNSGVVNELKLNQSTNATHLICLDSTKLRIECQVIRQFSVGIFLSFNVTLRLPNGSSPATMNFVYKTSTYKLPEIVKDDSGTNVYELIFFSSGIRMFDFNSDSYIVGQSGDLTIYSPTKLLENANGLLIDGFQSLKVES